MNVGTSLITGNFTVCEAYFSDNQPRNHKSFPLLALYPPTSGEIRSREKPDMYKAFPSQSRSHHAHHQYTNDTKKHSSFETISQRTMPNVALFGSLTTDDVNIVIKNYNSTDKMANYLHDVHQSNVRHIYAPSSANVPAPHRASYHLTQAWAKVDMFSAWLFCYR